jgi:hypothetical protein
MHVSSDRDFQTFETKVLWWLVRLERLRQSEFAYQKDHTYDTYKDRFRGLGCLATLVVKPFMRLQQELSSSNYQKLKRAREGLTRRAQQLLSQTEVRSPICTSLGGVKDDPTEIARTITRVLVSQSRSGAILIPLDADLFAMCALVIAGVGITKFCAGTIFKLEDWDEPFARRVT